MRACVFAEAHEPRIRRRRRIKGFCIERIHWPYIRDRHRLDITNHTTHIYMRVPYYIRYRMRWQMDGGRPVPAGYFCGKSRWRRCSRRNRAGAVWVHLGAHIVLFFHGNVYMIYTRRNCEGIHLLFGADRRVCCVVCRVVCRLSSSASSPSSSSAQSNQPWRGIGIN